MSIWRVSKIVKVHEDKGESNGKRYILRQATYTPSWVREEAQAKAVAATQDQVDSTEEIEIKQEQVHALS